MRLVSWCVSEGARRGRHLFFMGHTLPRCVAIPDISRVECFHIQGIRVVDVVVYLNALITQKMGALGSPEG